MPRLDDLNIKILQHLLKDGRKSFSEIAEEIESPVDAVAKRYRQMKSKGIIVGSTIQINYKAFGYNAVAKLSINAEANRVNEVIDFILKTPNIFFASQVYKKDNIGVIAKLKDLHELDCVRERIRTHPTVVEVKTQLWIDVRNIHDNILRDHLGEKSNGDKRSLMNQQATDEKLEIDEVDSQIISKLSADSRMPFKRIASELKVSSKVVKRRFEKLQNANAIKAIIQVDPTKLGYQAVAVFDVVLMSQSNISDTVEKLASIPDVVHITKISGDYDIEVMAWIRGFEHLFEVQKQLVALPNVKIWDKDIVKISNVSPVPQQYMSTF